MIEEKNNFKVETMQFCIENVEQVLGFFFFGSVNIILIFLGLDSELETLDVGKTYFYIQLIMIMIIVMCHLC